MVRMVMAEDDVGDLVRVDAQCLQRVEYQRPIAHHAGVDDHGRSAVPDQRDGARHVAAHIAGRQHVEGGVAFPWSIGHWAMLPYAARGHGPGLRTSEG